MYSLGLLMGMPVIFTLHNLGRSNTSFFYWVEFSQCNSWLRDCRIGLSCVFEELSLCLDELVDIWRSQIVVFALRYDHPLVLEIFVTVRTTLCLWGVACC